MSEGYRVVLLNSNPATIMTDPEFASATYIEPITPEIVAAIIEREQPDAILPTLGGQTALNVTAALHWSGHLADLGVELIGAGMDAIETAENRGLFRSAMEAAGLRCPQAAMAYSIEEAAEAAETIGYPIMVRPSTSLVGAEPGSLPIRMNWRR